MLGNDYGIIASPRQPTTGRRFVNLALTPPSDTSTGVKTETIDTYRNPQSPRFPRRAGRPVDGTGGINRPGWNNNRFGAAAKRGDGSLSVG
jgi:hypothetical protein